MKRDETGEQSPHPLELELEAMRKRAEAAERAAAEAQATVAALREALAAQGLVNDFSVGTTGREAGWCIGRCSHRGHEPECQQARAALATKPDDGALRALLLTAANLGYQDGESGSTRSPAEVAAHVLKGGA